MRDPAINRPPALASPARCAWIVTAGLVVGEPAPEFTRSWGMTSQEWERSDSIGLYNAHLVAAQEYARWLMEPQKLNWVRLEWIWY